MTRSGVGEVRTDVMDTTKTGERVAIEVSADHLQAWIRLADPDDPQPFNAEDIVPLLAEAKVAVDERVLERVAEFLGLPNQNAERPERFLVAEGRAAIESEDGTFQRHEAFLQREKDWQGDAAINYYTYNSIHMVEEDDAIGILISAVPGVNGVDVFGGILAPTRQPTEVELDATVRRSEDDPTVMVATVPGQIDFSGTLLSIREVFTLAHDVDFATGNIDSPVDVQIAGTVKDGFMVKCLRAITIGGAIESAEIEAEGNVLVRGGILQKGKSSVKSGGDIVARFCDEADLHALGDVKICKELMSSHVHCEGKLLAAHGAVIGGSVYAREGIEVATLGSDANVKTELVVGMHPDVVDEAERVRATLKSKRQAAERIRCAVRPLLAELKRLSPTQKEKATELMFEADAMDAGVAEAEDNCSAMLQDARARGIPYVLASKIVHQGVAIRIGRRITSFPKEMRGPLKIEKRKIDNVTEFVAINQLTGSISVLPSSYVREQPREEATETLDPGHGGRDGSGR